MTLPKIVFLDAATFGDVSLERFGEIGDCKIYQVTKPSETIGRLAGQDIVVTNKQPISEAALAAPESQNLSLIAVAATGTDIIDHTAARKRKRQGLQCPGLCRAVCGAVHDGVDLRTGYSRGPVRR